MRRRPPKRRGSPPPGWPALEGRLRREARRLRRRLGAASALAAGSASLALFLALTLLPRPLLDGRGSPIPLVAWLLFASLGVGTAAAAVRSRRRLEPRALASEAERAAGLAPGELMSALELERPRPGESGALAALHRDRVAEAVHGRAPSVLFPGAADRWRRHLGRALAAAAATLLLTVLTAATRPEAVAAAGGALARGWRIAFPPPLPTLSIEADGSRVVRGGWLTVRVRAPGRQRATLGWRSIGEPPRRRTLRPDPEGSASARIGPLEAPTRYWATAPDGSWTDTFLVVPSDELLVDRLRVRVLYPGHLGREPELHEMPVPALLVPEGSRLAIDGRASRDLRRARLSHEPGEQGPEGGNASNGREGPTVELAVDGARFSGRVAPRRSGRWSWEFEAAAEPEAGVVPPEPLRVEVVRDARPEVRIAFPERDTALGAERVLPLIVDARDDLGLRRAELLWWRSGRPGAETPRRTQPLPDAEGTRRVVARPLLDLRDLELLPGDTVSVLARAHDGHPGRAPVVSDTLRVTIAALPDLRRREADASATLTDGAAQALEEADELARAARDASLRAASGDPLARPGERGASSGELGFEGTGEARRALRRGEELEERLGELEKQALGLVERLAGGPLADPEVRRDLDRLAELYRELRESGLATRLAELEDALRKLDRDALRGALEALASGAERLRAELERSVGLLERAALEQEVEASRAEAERLAELQRGLAERMDDAAEWSARERGLAGEARELAGRLAGLERRLEETRAPEAGEAVSDAAEGASEADSAMEAAARAATGWHGRAGGGETGGSEAAGSETGGSEATGSGAAPRAAAEAAGALERTVRALSTAAGTMGREWREEALRALGDARQEALALAAEEADLGERLFGVSALEGPAWQARQTAVAEGVERVGRSLREAGRRSQAVARGLGPLAEEAREGLEAMLAEMAESGGRRRPSRDEVDRVADGLNELALHVLRSEDAVRASAEGSGEALRRMGALARQQQGLAQRTSGLVSPGRPAAGRRAELRGLAEEQAEIGRDLRELADREWLGRPEEMAREAARLAGRLAAGAADDEIVAGQRRLFRRMLDAGRSLEGEELDATRRESRVGRALPPEVVLPDPETFAGPRFPHPTEALLRELPAGYRRLVYEYFDRLNGRPDPGRPGGEEGRP